MELNSLMSISEAGVVLGVILEGTEYIPPIHRRWPVLEKLGFLILILALIADWHFQSAINERQTQNLISANNRIIALSPRYWLLSGQSAQAMVINLSAFRGQKIDIRIGPGVPEVAVMQEPDMFAAMLATLLVRAGWFAPDGSPLLLPKYEFRGANLEGLGIEIVTNAPSRTRSAAQALHKELKKMSLPVRTELTPMPNVSWPRGDDSSTIVLTVGNK
jgi:hypothetical protein